MVVSSFLLCVGDWVAKQMIGTLDVDMEFIAK